LLLQDASARAEDSSFELDSVTYCTSFVTDHKAQRRQDAYIQALEANGELKVLKGSYEMKTRTVPCPQCGKDHTVGFQREKRTDVNLAVGMLLAASQLEDPAEAILLVTGDTDLVPAIEAARGVFGVPVVVAAPPMRHQEHLNATATIYLRVGKRHLKYAPLPLSIQNQHGYYLSAPDGWIVVSDPSTQGSARRGNDAR
jgi:uncharacterized LabA/DUF88 family protein